MLPIAYPHPTGQSNPITVRAAAALPAAGAWDSVPLEIPVIAFDQITFYFSYDEGAEADEGTGAFDWYLEYSPYYADLAGVEDWFQMSLYDAGVLASGADTQSFIQKEYITYGATSSSVQNFTYGPLGIERTIERLRLVARESGDTDNPGTLHVVAVANGE